MKDRQKAMTWWHSLDEVAQARLSYIFPTETGSGVEKSWNLLKVQSTPIISEETIKEDAEREFPLEGRKFPYIGFDCFESYEHWQKSMREAYIKAAKKYSSKL